MTAARRWGAVWGLFVVSSGLYFLSDNEADNDLWIHVRIGLDVLASGIPRVDHYSYTVAGGPWIDHEWLLHALFGGLYRVGGGAALLLFKLGVGAATLAVLARSVARRSASVHVRGAVLVLAAAVLARGFAVRPQVVTYLGIALLWAFLDDEPRRDSPLRWLLVPVFALWANLHGGVLLGMAMTGLSAAWLLPSRPAEGLRLGAVVALSVVAAVAFNPYGLAYAGYVWRELGAPHPITEWQPVSLAAAHASFFVAAIVFLVALPFVREWRRRGWEATLAVLLLAAALLQQRHTPVFALCAAPVMAEGLDHLAARLGALARWRLSQGAQNALVAAIAIIALGQIAATAQRLWRDRLQIVFAPEEYPVAAVQRLAAAGAAGNLALPLEWGGYSLWHLAPRIKVSLDGRFATVYPHDVVEENFAFFSGRDEWKRLVDAYPTDAVLAPTQALPPIAASAGWQRVYSDDVATIIARDGSSVAEALRGDKAPTTPRPPVFP